MSQSIISSPNRFQVGSMPASWNSDIRQAQPATQATVPHEVWLTPQVPQSNCSGGRDSSLSFSASSRSTLTFRMVLIVL